MDKSLPTFLVIAKRLMPTCEITGSMNVNIFKALDIYYQMNFS